MPLEIKLRDKYCPLMENIISVTALRYFAVLHKTFHYITTDSLPWTDSPKPVHPPMLLFQPPFKDCQANIIHSPPFYAIFFHPFIL